MNKVVIGYFRTPQDAERTIEQLLIRGYKADTISFIAEQSNEYLYENDNVRMDLQEGQEIPAETFKEALFNADIDATDVQYYRYVLSLGDTLLGVNAVDEMAVNAAQALFTLAYNTETHTIGGGGQQSSADSLLSPQARRQKALAADDQRRTTQHSEDFARFDPQTSETEGSRPYYRSARTPLIDPRANPVRMPVISPAQPTRTPATSSPITNTNNRPFNVDRFTKPMKFPPKEAAENKGTEGEKK